MPSMPMFTTPERSETMPPRAPKISGVAKRSIAANRADHVTTSSRGPGPDCVAATAPPAPMTPAAIAPQPSRRSSRPATQMPPPLAITPRPTDGGGGRAGRDRREDDRRDRRAHERRRQRDEPRDHAEGDRGPRDVPRRERALA